ncbi:arylamine N-acetyltransferase family protein [Litorilituus lipolyticus]|uniref:arylamine N-acetyltransferase family protein n=1 Tax=Litorilituus lipolyticus TaxID=2491017 RepID=UPI0014791501|nr:arylamine N-acetyltransferase [Litorilituus lipolyticus]
MSVFNEKKYLQRLGITDDIHVDITSLYKLHNAQLFTIPFENFDVMLNGLIDLNPEIVFNKLVNNFRGGYCFELNSLLLSAMQSFGFDARALLARVHVAGVTTGRGHQVSLVMIGSEQWLVDVGFGSNSPRAPLKLIYDEEIHCDKQIFRFIADSQFGTMLQLWLDDEWSNLYSFDFEHVCIGDIEYGNHYTSTSKGSIFTQAYVAALHTENGVITLLQNQIKIKDNNAETIVQFDTDEEMKALAKNYLNIHF